MKLSTADVALVRAAASLAAHAPEKMRGSHLASGLESLAERMKEGLPLEAERAAAPMLRAA